MWYELIPGLAIMTGVTVVCLHFGALEKYLIAKGKTPRQAVLMHDWYTVKRDELLTGCKYRARGLEGLPPSE